MTRIPIVEDDVLFLDGDSFDLEALLAAVEPLGLHPKLGSRFSLIESDLKKMVMEHGVSYIWRLTRVTEAVLPATPGIRSALLVMVSEMLSRLAATSSLTVVDPYLVGDSSQNLLNDFISVIGDTTKNIATLRLITKPIGQSAFVADLRAALNASAPQCKVEHVASGRYHDRFWIVDETRGLFIGTSLNGIGNRYALVDYLAADDVTEIVADLKLHGLL